MCYRVTFEQPSKDKGGNKVNKVELALLYSLSTEPEIDRDKTIQDKYITRQIHDNQMTRHKFLTSAHNI